MAVFVGFLLVVSFSTVAAEDDDDEDEDSRSKSDSKRSQQNREKSERASEREDEREEKEERKETREKQDRREEENEDRREKKKSDSNPNPSKQERRNSRPANPVPDTPPTVPSPTLPPPSRDTAPPVPPLGGDSVSPPPVLPPESLPPSESGNPAPSPETATRPPTPEVNQGGAGGSPVSIPTSLENSLPSLVEQAPTEVLPDSLLSPEPKTPDASQPLDLGLLKGIEPDPYPPSKRIGPYADSPVASNPSGIPGWVAIAATGVLGGTSLLGIPSIRRNLRTRWNDLSTPQPLRHPKNIQQWIEHVRLRPLDGAAHFQLGIELLKRGQNSLAVQYLERAFRLQPATVLEFLKAPQYVPLLKRAEVHRVLKKYHRDMQRKLWTGYV